MIMDDLDYLDEVYPCDSCDFLCSLCPHGCPYGKDNYDFMEDCSV